MMMCKEYEARINALIDDELDASERIEVLEHIAQCPACKAYWEDLLSMRDMLRGQECSTPVGFSDAVMARVRVTKQDKATEKKVLRFPQWKRFAALAACCAVVALGVWAADFMPGVEAGSMNMSASNGAAAPETCDSISDSDVAESSTADYGVCDTDDAAVYNTMPGTAEEPDKAKNYAENPDFIAAILTDSEVAAKWVKDTLGKEWHSDAVYTLSEEQYYELRKMLEKSGDTFTEITGDESRSEYRLLAE